MMQCVFTTIVSGLNEAKASIIQQDNTFKYFVKFYQLNRSNGNEQFSIASIDLSEAICELTIRYQQIFLIYYDNNQ